MSRVPAAHVGLSLDSTVKVIAAPFRLMVILLELQRLQAIQFVRERQQRVVPVRA